MAKDSLHHVPLLDDVFPRLLALLRAPATVIVHEHVSNSAGKQALLGRMAPRFVERARRMFPTVDVPEEFLRDSANEDVSADKIRPLLLRHLHTLAQSEDLFLSNELELLVYYAYRKNKRLSYLARVTGGLLERFFLLRGERQHLSFVGRYDGPKDR
jgi:hypothetical protein